MNIDLRYTQPQLDIFFPAVPERHTVIPKGRRFGATRGAAHACIEWCIEGKAILWGDTVHGNIERYWDRYFEPALKASELRWKFDKVAKVARIGAGFIDFRSADNPENWEGFGYHKIIINEAGIVLKNHSLYTNTVRPMMVDFPDSEIYALGVPKGKMLKDGTEHPFYTMWKRVGSPGYRGQAYSSYDNPLLAEEDLRELEVDIAAMDPTQVQQEIYGQFLDRISGRPFAFAFDHAKHVKPCELDLRRPVIISVDFNVSPFCAVIAQEQGNSFVFAHEISTKAGTIDELAARIHAIAPATFMHLYTGDRTGANKRVQKSSTASLWDDFMDVMHARESQLTLPANPNHVPSREQVNYVLTHHPDLRINPRCVGLIRDLQVVEVDEEGGIVKHDRSKAAQQSDLLDGLRYAVNTYLGPWIQTHRSLHALRQHPNGTRPDPMHGAGRALVGRYFGT